MSLQRPNLAICLDDLRLEIRAALDCARRMGFAAVDVGATAGPVSPAELSQTGQRHFLRHLSDLGLRLGSLRGPASGPGYADAAGGERRLELMRRIIALASALRTPVVSTALGAIGMQSECGMATQFVVGQGAIPTLSRNSQPVSSSERARAGKPPVEPSVGAAGRLIEVLQTLADDADRCGVIVAVETAGIGAGELGEMLARIGCPSLVAACDTGAMLMRGEDPHRVADVLAGRIGLVRARDAVVGSVAAPGHEVALGDGALDVPRLLGALAESGFTGDIVLTRTTGESRAGDLARAKARFERHSVTTS